MRAMQDYETLIVFLSILPDFNLNHQFRIINENFNKTPKVLQTGRFFFNAIVTLTIATVSSYTSFLVFKQVISKLKIMKTEMKLLNLKKNVFENYKFDILNYKQKI